MTLLSRVADSLYWGARYLERAADTARLVRSYTELVIDLPTSVTTSWEPLLAVAGGEGSTRAEAPRGEIEIVRFLVADIGHRGSVASSVAQARENLRTTREVLPRDAWQTVNDLAMYVAANASSGVERRSRARVLSRLIAECQRIDGVMSTLMNRDHAYELWCLGQSLERADMTTRVLGVRAAALLAAGSGPGQDPLERLHDDVQWMGLLRSVSALQMYQRTTRGPIDPASAVRFLLLDGAFPRSVASCVERARLALAALPRSAGTLPAVDHVDEVIAAVAAGAARGAVLDGAALDTAMDEVQLALGGVDRAVHDAFVRSGG